MNCVFPLLIKLTGDILLLRKSEPIVLRAMMTVTESAFFLISKSLFMWINAVLKCVKRWNQVLNHCHPSTPVPDYLGFFIILCIKAQWRTKKVGWKRERRHQTVLYITYLMRKQKWEITDKWVPKLFRADFPINRILKATFTLVPILILGSTSDTKGQIHIFHLNDFFCIFMGKKKIKVSKTVVQVAHVL